MAKLNGIFENDVQLLRLKISLFCRFLNEKGLLEEFEVFASKFF